MIDSHYHISSALDDVPETTTENYHTPPLITKAFTFLCAIRRENYASPMTAV